jgi:hypothetical protein
MRPRSSRNREFRKTRESFLLCSLLLAFLATAVAAVVPSFGESLNIPRAWNDVHLGMTLAELKKVKPQIRETVHLQRVPDFDLQQFDPQADAFEQCEAVGCPGVVVYLDVNGTPGRAGYFGYTYFNGRLASFDCYMHQKQAEEIDREWRTKYGNPKPDVQWQKELQLLTPNADVTGLTDHDGVATFNDLKIDWLGNGYRLIAQTTASDGTLSAISDPFNEFRVGDPCLAADMPACSSGCADTDLDGLNDAWERAGGVDLNGDGVITDSYHDVLLPGADLNKPDIYLKYDYMLTADHSHQPPAKAWDQMTAMFAAHGIALHVMPPSSGIPEHKVTTLDSGAHPACAGNDFITMQQLRAQYFSNLQPAYHYMVFAHDVETPNSGVLVGGCKEDALCHALPSAGATGNSEILGDDSIVSFGRYTDSNTQIGIELWASTMMHELGHNFGLVHGSLADSGGGCSTVADCGSGRECIGGRCMDRGQACLTKKPNYISVMNYTYQTGGISPNGTPGTPIHGISCTGDADCAPPNVTSGNCATHPCFCTDDGGPGNNFCYRPDYAEDNLLNLNESTLDENVGVGGPADLDDIVFFWNAGSAVAAPSNGSPIDWDNNGAIENLSTCVRLLPPGQGPNGNCPDVDDNGTNGDLMDTTADWTQVNGQFIHFNFQFQCTPGYDNDRPASGSPTNALAPEAPTSSAKDQVITQQ